MPNSLNTWNIENGYIFKCGLVSVDIVNSSRFSNLVDANKSKEKIEKIVERYANDVNGKFKWDGDGGLIFTRINDSNDSINLLTLAIRIKSELEIFNFDYVNGNLLDENIDIRIVCHQGDASFDENARRINGDCINFLSKNEKNIGIPNELIITNSVFDRLKKNIKNKYFTSNTTITYENKSTLKTEEITTYAYGIKKYCSSHRFFLNQVENLFKFEDPKEDISDLFYLFLNIKSECFIDAKHYIQNDLTDLILRGDKFKLYNFNIWSLHGSSEMIIEFRSSNEDAKEFKNQIKTDVGDYLRVESRRNVLEKDSKPIHLEKDPELINVKEERPGNAGIQSNVENIQDFQCGKILMIGDKSKFKKYRTIKAFIKLKIIGSEDSTFKDFKYNSIRNSLLEYSSIIEKISKDIENKIIIIDLNMPCGLYPLLNELSKSLEDVIYESCVKSTYIAYDHV